jgi:hypothetical protein
MGQFRWKKLAAATALAGAALISWQVLAARPLTVVSWGGGYQDAQKAAYFEPFKAASGTDMIDESWDGGIGVLRSKVEGGTDSGWDVVQVESEELQIGCDEGLFVPLDWSKIGDKDAFMDAAVSECGVGAIVYDFVLGGLGGLLRHREISRQARLAARPEDHSRNRLDGRRGRPRRSLQRAVDAGRRGAGLRQAEHHQERCHLVEVRRPAAAAFGFRRGRADVGL